MPSQKKPILGTKNGVMCYYKLKPFEKERFILECLLKPSVTFNALNGSRSVEATDITTNVIRISNDIRDETSIDIKRIEKCCDEAAWMAVLTLIEKKKKRKWTCSLYEKCINQNKESVACDMRYMGSFNLNLKSFPSRVNGFV